MAAISFFTAIKNFVRRYHIGRAIVYHLNVEPISHTKLPIDPLLNRPYKILRILLTKCLEMEGCSVLTANDGQEALELFKRENFDLAFLYIKMPLLSGTEVLKQIRGMGINTPVIIITAYATVKNAV